jgi:hypothetical protein
MSKIKAGHHLISFFFALIAYKIYSRLQVVQYPVV